MHVAHMRVLSYVRRAESMPKANWRLVESSTQGGVDMQVDAS